MQVVSPLGSHLTNPLEKPLTEFLSQSQILGVEVRPITAAVQTVLVQRERMMVLKDLKEAYDYYSGKVSEICRQFSFAGIALVWIFKAEIDGQYSIPSDLLWPLFLFVICLSLDLLHYASSAAIWGVYNRFKESRVGESEEFRAPPSLNWIGLILFWGKVCVLILAYIHVFLYVKSLLL